MDFTKFNHEKNGKENHKTDEYISNTINNDSCVNDLDHNYKKNLWFLSLYPKLTQ